MHTSLLGLLGGIGPDADEELNELFRPRPAQRESRHFVKRRLRGFVAELLAVFPQPFVFDFAVSV
jgi:hypothetical protein